MPLLNTRLVLGDCLEVMPTLREGSIDSVVTDPPYALTDKAGRKGFMSQTWDSSLPTVEHWQAVLRVLRPGGYMLAFGGSRTYHRLACAIEDAGFEVRDSILYLHDNAPRWQAFLDSLSDEQRGTFEELIASPGTRFWNYGSGFPKGRGNLKPSYEAILLARKPGPKVLPLGIDDCRVPCEQRPNIEPDRRRITGNTFNGGPDGSLCGSKANGTTTQGRYPPNVILDDSEEVREAFARFGEKKSAGHYKEPGPTGVGGKSIFSLKEKVRENNYAGDTGTAARYFMCCPPDAAIEVDNCDFSWHTDALGKSQEINRCCEHASFAVANSLLGPLMSSEGTAGSVAGGVVRRKHEREESQMHGGCKAGTVDGTGCGENQVVGKSTDSSKVAGSGKCQTVRSQKDTTFTTAIETTKTTICPTCNSCLQVNITLSTSEKEKTTRYLLTVRRLEGVNVARSIDPSANSPGGQQELFTATASPALLNTSESGDVRTSNGGYFACCPADNEDLRFLYCPKASRRERNAGLEDKTTEGKQGARPGSPDPTGKFPDHDHRERGGNNHPCVKPLSLMEWLIKLVCPPGGVCLDPFLGSGTTAVAALRVGRKCIGIEREASYLEIARARVAHARAEKMASMAANGSTH